MAEVSGWEGHAILELLGHRRLAGYLSEQTIAGSSFLRLDIPGEEGKPAVSQFYSGASVYCITPCDEETARAVAASLTERGPISRYELPQLQAGRSSRGRRQDACLGCDDWTEDCEGKEFCEE